jgi:uncharacterized protein (TIRG00374 family)
LKRWLFWLGIIISVFLLWIALRNLQPINVWQELQGAKYGWIIPGVGVYFLGVWARAWRWHYLLRPLKKIPTKTMFPIVAIGYMGNNIYPARAGEVLRAYVLRRKESIPISASLATIVVERAFDGIVMLAFVFLNLSELLSLSDDSGFIGDIRTLTLLGSGLFLAAVIVLLLMAVYPDRSLEFFDNLISRFIPSKFRTSSSSMLERFIGGMASLRSPTDIVMVLLTSVVIWLFETGKYWFVMQAFAFEVSFFALMLMNGIVNLATTIPSAPGYIGTFDAPGIAILKAYNVPEDTAASYTLVLHAALWLPITVLGAYYMARERITWRSVQAEMGEEKE